MTTALSALLNAGVEVSVDKTGALRLRGLAKLEPERKAQIIEYARANKPAIVKALSKPGDLWQKPIFSDISRLPAACPLVTGDACPPKCRYDTKFFLRMIGEGVLPTAEGCPLLAVCGLRCTDDAAGPEISAPREMSTKTDTDPGEKPETPTGAPGECESCPAAGFWDFQQYAGQLLCFYRAYYLGRSGRPKPCSQIRSDCPRIDHGKNQ